MPNISIVIPIYNATNHLAETLESVLAQTLTDWELILVDDGSTDGSVTLAENYAARDPRIRVVRQANRGVVAARNRGIQGAGAASKFLIMLDHDDVWEIDALSVLHEAVLACPDAVAAHGRPRFIDGDGNPAVGVTGETSEPERIGIVNGRLIPWPPESPTTFAVMAYGNCIITPGQVLIRRSVLAAVGPLDPSCRPADDWDLWLRLTRLGDIAFVNQIILRYRVHSNNVSRQRHVMDEAGWAVRRKVIRAPENTPEQRQMARLGSRICYRQACIRRLKWAGEHLAKRELGQAIKQLRHVVISFARSLF